MKRCRIASRGAVGKGTSTIWQGEYDIQPEDARLRELILLICKGSEGDPRFGAVKLNKLLFYCDFSAYAKLGKSITGQEYLALPEGPALKKLKPFTG